MLSAALAIGLAVAALPARAEDNVLLCVRNNTGWIMKFNMTLYTGSPENRWDTGWRTMAAGQQHCERRQDMKAANITVDVLETVQWNRRCNRNWRPTRSLVFELQQSGMYVQCAER